MADGKWQMANGVERGSIDSALSSQHSALSHDSALSTQHSALGLDADALLTRAAERYIEVETKYEGYLLRARQR